MKKISIPRETRLQYLEKWTREFSAFKARTLHPAELCARILEIVWADVFGPFYDNGSFPAQLLNKRLKFLSTHVNLVLDRWYQNEINLELTFHKPSPLEILEFQSQGKRVVSLLMEPDEILNFEEQGRNFASFLIHDLVHASHFFTNEEGEFQRQVIFSSWMKTLVENGTWELIKAHGPTVQAQFEYLISDMNTHTWHLIKTLKSLLDQNKMTEIEERVLRVMPRSLQEHWSKINSAEETLELTTEFLDQMLAKTPVRNLTGAYQVCL